MMIAAELLKEAKELLRHTKCIEEDALQCPACSLESRIDDALSLTVCKPDAYLVVNDQGYVKGAWRDRAIAEDIASRGQPSHHERVVPVRSFDPLPEIPA